MNKKQLIVLLNKNTGEEDRIPARDFLNPKGSSFTDNSLKPRTFNQSFTMIMDLIEGEIYQNMQSAIKLDGFKYRWDWSENQPSSGSSGSTKDSSSSDISLPKSTADRIATDSYRKYNGVSQGAEREAYRKGGEAEAEMAQNLVDGLELIKRKLTGMNDIVTNDIISICDTYLQQWRDKR